uniref:Endoplasmic reticulum transmembrane protein n=1 Tax=Nelumbo nucifera TaxID=4432 RepID=A0A822ZIC3_NELNU|nr:TPA_asm: hypothetical protein HUJ06_004084 [Nelumbo nucifera]
MALEWVVLGYVAAAEAIMLLLTSSNLFLAVIPFCLFLLMDIYWKYETCPAYEGQSCTPTEHFRHQKSNMKSQRNLLYSITHHVLQLDQLHQCIEKLKNHKE